MRPMIAGNWKMNGTTAFAIDLAQAVAAGVSRLACDLLICPPATQITALRPILAPSGVFLGAQDCHQEPNGAHTGDLSATMLADAGATHVILGHSERRRDHGETSELVREKVAAALAAGLVPIVCVGETEEQRAAGQHTEAVGWQIAGSLPKPFAGLLAYEPIWAIGTGRACGPEAVAEMHGFIRAELIRQFGPVDGASPRILYGGSVKPDNAAALLAVPEVGGALIGGASLVAADFLAIASAVRG